MSHSPLPLLSLLRLQVDEVLQDFVAQVLVNDPVHQLEAGEGHGEDDPAVLVNVRGRHAEHLVQLLHVAVGVCGRSRGSGGWRGLSRRGRGRRRPVVHGRHRRRRPVRRSLDVVAASAAAPVAIDLRLHMVHCCSPLTVTLLEAAKNCQCKLLSLYFMIFRTKRCYFGPKTAT